MYVIGAAFILMSGILYTLELISNYVPENIKWAGLYAGDFFGEVPSPYLHGFVNNIYVPAFLLTGIAIIANASLRKP